MDAGPLTEIARRLVDEGSTPACQFAVARENELVAFESFGAATNTTRFCVFSATKPIVASAVWVLIGEQLLDPARPVAHYIPEFASNGKEHVTVEQVMLHTAGFPNAPMDPVEGGDAVTRVKRFTEWSLEWEPGTRFEYHATSAHWVLAELIERLGGYDFRDYIESQVCAPNGLPRLLGLAPEEQSDIADGVALGTRPDDSDIPAVDTLKLNRPDWRAAGVPGGGGLMTAATMALFYQALLHDPNGVWDAAVLQRRQDQHPLHVPRSADARGREPVARSRARRRRRPPPVPLRHVRQGELAGDVRPRGRALPGRLGRPRERYLVLVRQERTAG